MNLKEPLTYKDQITRLEEHNMIITDRDHAERFLSKVNYYRFTGYALQYRIDPHNSNYIPGVTFELITRIYQFDLEIRHILRKYIDVLEVFFRTKISYHFSIAKCVEPPYDQHYCCDNYYNKSRAKAVLENFKDKKEYYKDSLVIKHHQNKYNGKYPLWVIIEMISFSDLSKLYSCMYDEEEDAIAETVSAGRSTLRNHLHCLSVLRNKCAHAARLYNSEFNPPAQFSQKFLRKYSEVINNTLFAYILVILRHLPEMNMKLLLINNIVDLVNEYSNVINISLLGFPDDYEIILRSIR